MSKAKALASLRKWKKCQRRVANSVLRAAKAGKANAAKKSQLKAAANAFASVACSKGVKKTRRSKRGSKRFSSRDFKLQQEMELRALRNQPAEPMFNPEVSY